MELPFVDRPLGGWDGHHRVELAIGWLLDGYWVGWIGHWMDGVATGWVGNWVDETGVTEWLEKPFCWWVSRQVDVIVHYVGGVATRFVV